VIAARLSRPLLVVTAAAAVRLVFAALIPLLPDEAYYWAWSRHLAPGYFDHPYGVALLIRFGDALLAPIGNAATPLSVRLGPVIAGWIASVGTVAVAHRMAGDTAAMRAALFMSVLPLAAAGLVLATPDSPLLATTAIALYCLVRVLESPIGTSASFRWWIATGVALGLAFSSKYTSIFLPVAVLIAVLVHPELRGRLRESGPYLACVVAALVFTPVLVWNVRHGWISFVFQVRHGLSAPQGSALVAAWKHEGDFFGAQAALASPILFIMMAIAVVAALRRGGSGVRFMLATVALVSFGFFVYSALRQRVEPNWPAPAYIPAVVLLATTSWGKRGVAWLKAGGALAALMSLVIYAQAVEPVLPIPPAKDPIARAYGWRELAAAAQSAAAAGGSPRTKTWLGGDRYQEASEISFHDPLHRTTFSTNLSGRRNQYDLWPQFPDVAQAGDNLILVLDDVAELHATVRALSPYFGAVKRGEQVVLRRGSGEIGTRRVWELSGWRGGWPERAAP
jgi:4-amino-4-deoxy-L-arabinose transferase-like glycosyltransferase